MSKHAISLTNEFELLMSHQLTDIDAIDNLSTLLKNAKNVDFAKIARYVGNQLKIYINDIENYDITNIYEDLYKLKDSECYGNIAKFIMRKLNLMITDDNEFDILYNKLKSIITSDSDKLILDEMYKYIHTPNYVISDDFNNILIDSFMKGNKKNNIYMYTLNKYMNPTSTNNNDPDDLGLIQLEDNIDQLLHSLINISDLVNIDNDTDNDDFNSISSNFDDNSSDNDDDNNDDADNDESSNIIDEIIKHI